MLCTISDQKEISGHAEHSDTQILTTIYEDALTSIKKLIPHYAVIIISYNDILVIYKQLTCIEDMSRNETNEEWRKSHGRFMLNNNFFNDHERKCI